MAMKKLLLAGIAALLLATGTAQAFNLADRMENDSYVQCGEIWFYKLPNGEMRSNMGYGTLPITVKDNEVYLGDKLCVFRVFSCTTLPQKKC
jgi:hypothetical protein